MMFTIGLWIAVTTCFGLTTHIFDLAVHFVAREYVDEIFIFAFCGVTPSCSLRMHSCQCLKSAG